MLLLVVATAAGGLFGRGENSGPLPVQIAHAVLGASVSVYVILLLLDGAEHFRLEHHVTGRLFSWTVVPFGESVIHTGLVLTLIVALFLARPIAGDVAPRDWFVLGSPLLFLGLGWYDELVYHRRRALHREDILHTISHLAAAVFLVSLFVAKVFDSRSIW